MEREYNVETKSWWLGSELSYIEIDPNVNLTIDEIASVEHLCNESIKASVPVSVKILSAENKNGSDEVELTSRKNNL